MKFLSMLWNCLLFLWKVMDLWISINSEANIKKGLEFLEDKYPFEVGKLEFSYRPNAVEIIIITFCGSSNAAT